MTDVLPRELTTGGVMGILRLVHEFFVNRIFSYIVSLLVFAEPSMENDNQPRANFWVDEQLVSEASLVSNCEKHAEAASGNQTEISTVRSSQSQNSRKRKISESSCEPGMQNVFFF